MRLARRFAERSAGSDGRADALLLLTVLAAIWFLKRVVGRALVRLMTD
jgi:hypothetical protein